MSRPLPKFFELYLSASKAEIGSMTDEHIFTASLMVFSIIETGVTFRFLNRMLTCEGTAGGISVV
jgi:hypothetical protein